MEETQKKKPKKIKAPVEKKPAAPVGAPTKYRPEYNQMLIDHLATGLSFETFGGKIKVDRATIYNWCTDFPEFLDAKKVGMLQCQLFWEQTGIEGLWTESSQGNSRSLNATVWIFNMKNRFGWKDRQEVEDVSKPKEEKLIIQFSNNQEINDDENS